MGDDITIKDFDGKDIPLYKGDGKNSCRWCGDTGWMHTFSNDGRRYSDSPCICKKGDEVAKKRREDKNE